MTLTLTLTLSLAKYLTGSVEITWRMRSNPNPNPIPSPIVINFASGEFRATPEHIIFTKDKKKSGPEHHHFKFFAVPETIIFKISLLSTRSSPPTTGSARKRSAAIRVSGRPEWQPDAFSRSSSVRSPPLSLCHGTYLVPKFRVSTPPPRVPYAYDHEVKRIVRVSKIIGVLPFFFLSWATSIF